MSVPSLRVLLVEDQFLIARQLEVIFVGAGHQVVGIASSREEACAMAISENPDIAFVDVSLADGPTGADVAQFIANNCKARVVFTTANRKRLPVDLCGALGVVDKPFTPAGMVAALNFIIHKWFSNSPLSFKQPPSFEIGPAFSQA